MKPSSRAHREPLTFSLVLLIVSIFLGFAGNLVTAAVDVDSRTWKSLVFGSSSAAVLVLGVYLVWHFWRPLGIELSRTVVDRARPCKGLVVLVSPGRGSESAKDAIRYHAKTLEKAWLVHSDASRDAADEIVEELGQEDGLRAEQFKKVHVIDMNFENSPDAVREAIERDVFQKLPAGLADSDVIVDITGGRKATTAGAFLAALPPGRRVEIVNPKRTDRRHRGTEADEPLEIAVDYRVSRG